MRHWNKSHLVQALGGRYQHVRELGNADYKGGPVRIVDYEAGRLQIDLSERPVVLMCACSDPAVCHRTAVARLLVADGYDVTELSHSQVAELGGQMRLDF